MEKFFKVKSPWIVDGSGLMQGNTDLTEWNDSLERLGIGNQMFYGCSNLKSFTSDLSSLIQGNTMFSNCTNLTKINVPHMNNLGYSEELESIDKEDIKNEFRGLFESLCGLGSMYIAYIEVYPAMMLSDCTGMFVNCSNLQHFNCAEMNSLFIGAFMFANCSSLKTFTTQLSSLCFSNGMFANCSSIEAFTSDLSSLIWGCDSPTYEAYIKQMIEDSGDEVPPEALEEINLMLSMCKGMFHNCSSLKYFKSNLSSLENGDNMFKGCYNLTSFDADLGSLFTGFGMFSDCILNKSSIARIAASIQDLTITTVVPLWKSFYDIDNGIITIGYHPDIPMSFLEEQQQIMEAKGWSVLWEKGKIEKPVEPEVEIPVSLDITTENGYIPDASLWNKKVYSVVKPQITSVADGKCFYKEEEICLIDNANIVDGSNLMKGVKTLTSWNGSLESLNNGTNMFSGCAKLTSFNGDLSSLINGTYMFSGCKLDEDSVVHISNIIQDISSLELSKGEGKITINHDPNIPTSVLEECGNRMAAKGWVVVFNVIAFGVSYDITTENGYIPNASKWNNEIYKTYFLTVTSVDSGKLYNETKEIGLIDNANIVDGSNLMKGNSKLESWNGSLESLTKGSNMFNGCSNLISFTGSLASLTNGTDMFKGCNLDEASVVHISNTINDISSLELNNSERTIIIHHDSNIPTSVLEECGQRFADKGWLVYFNSLVFGVSYDITQKNGYIPNASKWNTDMYKKFSLTVTSVADGKLYNGTEEIALIDSANIVNGSSLMNSNTALTSWNGSLESLTNGSNMFNGCSNLTSFTGSLSSLTDAVDMFNGCMLDEASVVHISNTINDISSLGTAKNITIHHDSNISKEVLDDCGNKIASKGWKVKFNVYTYPGVFDIVVANGYIPDASKWYDKVYVPNSLTVTSVADGKLYNGSDIVCLIDGDNMVNGTKLMYKNTALTSWSEPLPKLQNADYMFYNCTALSTFECEDLSSLTNGTQMFRYCPKITSFDADLSSLTDGYYMFHSCYGLTSFDADLSSLTDGYSMFEYCYSLTSFNSDLSSLGSSVSRAGQWMFYNCSKLTTFNADLSSLIDGYNMFAYCSKLTTFNSNLSSLLRGRQMFNSCKLNSESLQNIANTINDLRLVTEVDVFDEDLGYISLGISSDIPSDIKTSCGDLMVQKGWKVYFNYSLYGNGNPNWGFYPKNYDVTKENGFISDARRWNELVYQKYNLVITSVVNEIAYNGSEQVCVIDSSAINNGYYLMMGNTNLVEWNSPFSGTYSGYMFYNCTALTTVNGFKAGILSSLTFYNCTSLTSFNGDLSNLSASDGQGLFWGCSLNGASITNIADTIKDISSAYNKGSRLDIGYGDVDKATLITEGNRILSKGWGLYYNNAIFTGAFAESPYEITADNGYIPDASKWNDNVYVPNSLTVTSVSNGYLMNGSEIICKIEGSDMVNGSKLMYKNTALTSWSEPLTSLQLSQNMFQGCTSLTTFTSDLPALTDGYSMFQGCYSLTTFDCDDLSSLTNGSSMFNGCTSLASFNEDLSSLTNGSYMFSGCSLNGASITNIANTIKDISGTSYNGGRLDIGHGDVDKATLTTEGNKILAKGWKLYYNNVEFTGAFVESPYEITAANKYIPDASTWYDNVYVPNSLTVTSVANGYLMNGSEIICKIESDDMVNGNELMYQNTALTTWDAPLPKLQKGQYMFRGCSKITSFNAGDMNALTDGTYMLYGCNKIKTFNSDFNSLTTASYMFCNCTALSTFECEDLSSLTNGTQMFRYCPKITSFNIDLKALTTGQYMFRQCYGLTAFNSDLSALTNGTYMFYGCYSLTSFNATLKSLANGNNMFYDCKNLTTFVSDLSALTKVGSIFYNCYGLTSFNASLRSLLYGDNMFSGFYNLTSFTSELSSLRSAYNMFSGCKLDAASIENIANTIKDVSNLTLNDTEGIIHIDNDPTVSTETLIECGKKMVQKGWVVMFTSMSFGLEPDITEENGYIPDASKWNSKVFSKLTEVPTSVSNGYAWNASTQLFRVDSPNIVNGTNLMYYNSDLIEWNDSLESLELGSYMFYNCYSLTTFNSDLSSLTNGQYMFWYCENLTEFICDLPAITDATEMFSECHSLTTFKGDLSSLTNGQSMFFGNYQLKTFDGGDLSSLTNGVAMFGSCNNLTTFTSDLPALTNGQGMFYDSGIKSFNGDLSNLTQASEMFYECRSLTTFYSDLSSLTYMSDMFLGCTNLTTFYADLSSLTTCSFAFLGASDKLTTFYSDLSSLITANEMFSDCYKLENFDANLGSLINGQYMFQYCNLSSNSLQNIANTINDLTLLEKNDFLIDYHPAKTGRIDISHSSTVPQDVITQCGNALVAKGWAVSFNNVFFGNGNANTKISLVQDDYNINVTQQDGYIPNASQWNSKVFSAYDLPITDVINEVAYDNYYKVCDVDSSEIVNGSNLMRYNNLLKSWSSPLTKLQNGTNMFQECRNLTSFNGDLSSLRNGTNMFYNCKLDVASIANIANTINDLTLIDSLSSNEGRLDITYNSSISFADIKKSIDSIHRKGWVLYLNGELYESIDVIAQNGYIPDASQWNEKVYIKRGLTIKRVVDGVAYDE